MSQSTVDTNHPINEIKQIFMADEMYPTSLLILALKFFTVEELQDFEPKTIRLELQEALRTPVIPSDTFDKLMSALTIFNTDMFFKDVAVFNDLCNIMSGFPTDIDEYEPPEPIEMAFAVHQARLIDPLDGDKDEMVFSDDIKLYMGSILAENGYSSVPPCLKEAVIPDPYLKNASSFLSDSAFLPAIVDNTKLLIDDLESELTKMKASLQAQIDTVKKLPKMSNNRS